MNKRYLAKMNDYVFHNLKGRQKLYRLEWVFDDHIIRYNGSSKCWTTHIVKSDGSRTTVGIGDQDRKELDSTCNMSMRITMRYPCIDSVKLFIEQCVVTNPNGELITIYSTKTSTEAEDINARTLLPKLDIELLAEYGDIPIAIMVGMLLSDNKI